MPKSTDNDTFSDLPMELCLVIAENVETEVLEVLRLTCRRLRYVCDSVLARHITVTLQIKRVDEFNWDLGLDISHVRFTAPNGNKRIAGLGLLPAPVTSERVPDPLRRLFGFTRVLSLDDPIRYSDIEEYYNSGFGLQPQDIAESLETVLSWFSNVRKLRIWDHEEELFLPFTRNLQTPLTSLACRGVLRACKLFSPSQPFFRLNAHIPPTSQSVTISLLLVSLFPSDIPEETHVASYPPSVKEVMLLFDLHENSIYDWERVEWKQVECVIVDGIKDRSRSDIKYTMLATPSRREGWYLPEDSAGRFAKLIAKFRPHFPDMRVVGEEEFRARGFERAACRGADADFLRYWRGHSHDRRKRTDLVQWREAFADKVTRAIAWLEDDFLSMDRAVSCAGTIPLGDVELSLATPGYIFIDEASKPLLEACSPAPFGRERRTVFDEQYRRAREIRAPLFQLSVDLISKGKVLQQIKGMLKISRPLHAVPTKVNVYGEGGFFKAHVDTSQGDNHVGTITMCLPSHFAGGELVVRHRGDVTSYNWKKSRYHPPAASWAFLFSDCEHEVLPVTHGTRVAIAYDVFTGPASAAEAGSATDLMSTMSLSDAANRSLTGVTTRSPKPEVLGTAAFAGLPAAPVDPDLAKLLKSLRRALERPYVLPEGGVLAFGLQHSYALTTHKGDEKRFEGELKGLDAVWARALAAAGLPCEVVAAYSRQDEIKLYPHYKERDFTACRDFNALDEHYMECAGDDTSFREGATLLDARQQPVIWVTEHWTAQEDIWVTGNDAGAPESVYVGAALWTYVGPLGKRSEPSSPNLADAVLYHPPTWQQQKSME